jgi:hypothetical protein
VTQDGNVDANLLVPSSSAYFNAVALGVVRSFQSDPMLQFPPGSKRRIIEGSCGFIEPPTIKPTLEVLQRLQGREFTLGQIQQLQKLSGEQIDKLLGMSSEQTVHMIKMTPEQICDLGKLPAEQFDQTLESWTQEAKASQ